MNKIRIPDVPTCDGMANALRRARQLADLRWTPIRPFPAGMPEGIQPKPGTAKVYYPIFLSPWRPQTGANYSAARFDEKYIGFNVSLHTYMTALANPDSVLYTRSLHGKAPLSSAFYGTVCSEFVSYVLDLPFHIDCQQWPFLPGAEVIDPLPLENLRLCDVLNERTRHTAVITGIARDEEGNVVDITVTESTLPHIQSRTFTPEEFVHYWLEDGYEVVRCHWLDKVTYTPNPWNPLEGDPETERPAPNSAILPNYGDRANYLLGEEVVLSIFDAAFSAVELTLNGEGVTLPVVEGKVCLTPDKPGLYQAAAVGEKGKSAPAEFCVVEATVIPDKAEYKAGEPVRPAFSNPSGDKLVGWVVKTPGLAKVWGYPMDEAGTIPDHAVLEPGEYRIIALYRNNFGVYSSHPCDTFTVTP